MDSAESMQEANSCSDSKDEFFSTSVKRSYNRRFREQWKTVFDWLENRNNSSFCVACERTLNNNLAHLRTHDGNVRHRKKLKQYLASNSQHNKLLEKTTETPAIAKKNYFKEKLPQNSSPAGIRKYLKQEVDQLDILAAELSNLEQTVESHTDDPLAMKSKRPKLNNSANQHQAHKCLQTFNMKQADEFSYFGMNIAAQLRSMPLVNALRLQASFQDLLTKERIKLNENSI